MSDVARRTERYDTLRLTLLQWYAAAFAVWVGALAVLMVFVVNMGSGLALTQMPTLPKAAAMALLGLQLAAFTVWFASLVALMFVGFKIKREPALKRALSDERSHENTRVAFVTAFWVVIVTAALAIPMEVGLEVVLPASSYGLVLIWVGVTTALGVFVWRERRDAG